MISKTVASGGDRFGGHCNPTLRGRAVRSFLQTMICAIGVAAAAVFAANGGQPLLALDCDTVETSSDNDDSLCEGV